MKNMDTVRLTINGIEVETKKGMTILEAARSVNIYIPSLCYHPDLPPAPRMKLNDHVYRDGKSIGCTESIPKEFEGCQLCIVEIEGTEGFPTACNTPVTEGMFVHTETLRVQELRRDNLAAILANHPHACLVCAEREGCSREPCSLNVPVDERCCDKFGACELQKVAEYIGVKQDIPRYIFTEIPVEDSPLFIRDYNLCIGCGRCVRVCRDVRGVEALGLIYHDGEFIVGTVGPSLKESECRFCGACVEVCPTGALRDKDLEWPVPKEDIVPCKQACPVDVDIPRYIHLVSEGKFAEAAAVIRERVPFPLVLGYVCHSPCESKCRRGKLDEALSIGALKRFAAERDTELLKTRFKETSPTHKRVAIVGSGPTGLTVAYYLARKGHMVTVFEALPEPGGMMRVGIPEFRLPKKILQMDINEILRQGVELKLNNPIGKAVTLNDLGRRGYHAVFLAVGAQASRKPNIEGEELKGVIQAIDFLREVNLGREVKLGETIAVVGGGDVAVDAARVALQLGCKEVYLVYRRSGEEMLANPEEVKRLKEEGAKIHFQAAPRRILGKDGKVTAVEFTRTILGEPDESGRRRPMPVDGSEYIMELDEVILAIGQSLDLTLIPKELKITKQNDVWVDSKTLETSLPGIFAGGDAVTGPASVIDAIAAGRKAAASIDKYLGGDGNIEEILIETEEPDPWLGKEKGFGEKDRIQMPCLPIKQRRTNFSLVELGFNEEKAIEEAKRCLRCDLRLRISQVKLPPEGWLEFNATNVGSIPDNSGVYQLLDDKKIIIYVAGVPNLRQALEEKLKKVEKARYFGYEEHPMYSMRESELFQKFLKEHGRMPELNEDVYDLF